MFRTMWVRTFYILFGGNDFGRVANKNGREEGQWSTNDRIKNMFLTVQFIACFFKQLQCVKSVFKDFLVLSIIIQNYTQMHIWGWGRVPTLILLLLHPWFRNIRSCVKNPRFWWKLLVVVPKPFLTPLSFLQKLPTKRAIPCCRYQPSCGHRDIKMYFVFKKLQMLY